MLFDETLPSSGEVADRVASYRGQIVALVSESLLAQLPERRRGAARVEIEALSAALLGAAEELARWWLRTEAISAGEAAELLISTVEPGIRARSGRRRLPHFAQTRERNPQSMNTETRRVAVIGGNRIPFARSDTKYAHATNQDMLTAALDGLIDRYGLEGETLGEVAGGAVLKHSHDRDLTRESVLSTRLAPETPAYDVQQACGTGLETAILVANKIALGQIDVGIACGADTTSDAPIELNEELRATLLDANRAALDRRQTEDAGALPPRPHRPPRPPQRGAAHRPLDGRAHARSWRRNGTSAGPSRTSSRSPRTRTSPPPTSAASRPT